VKIGLIDVDSKWPNLALMKLSAYHKGLGDQVEWYLPLMEHSYDRVYASKVFTHTPDDEYIPDGAIRGGTGYSTYSSLEPWHEFMKPDYSIYPAYKRDIGFLTRGCLRNCPWCVVPKFEGDLRVVKDFDEVWTGRKEICFLDNNILGLPSTFRRAVEKAREHGIKISFNQGLDIRLLDSASAGLLSHMPTYEALHFGFDSLDYADEFVDGCQLLRKHELIGRTIFLFLVGFGTTIGEEIERLKIAVDQKAAVYFMLYSGGEKLKGPFGDTDFLMSTDTVIRAPVGNLRRYRRAVKKAMKNS